MPCSTSRIIAVAANVLEIDAIGNTVCAVTGSGSSTLVTPSPRMVTTPSGTMPSATPGHAVLLHLRFGEGDERLEARVGGDGLRTRLAMRAAGDRDQDGCDADRESSREERAHARYSS